MIFDVFDFFQNMNENKSSSSSKKNSFVRFLEEFEDTKNHFKINWPLLDLDTSPSNLKTT